MLTLSLVVPSAGAAQSAFGVFVNLEGDHGSLEILRMDENTKPGGPRNTRRQHGVVVIFENTDRTEVVRGAKVVGSPLIARWNSS